MIVERELMPFGMVNTSNPTWASYGTARYFDIRDPSVRDGRDYHTLTWDKRAINLDSVEVPVGKVVTGVRFRIIDGAITLQVRGTEFDFSSGLLKNTDNSFWYTSARKERQEFVLENPDIPINTKEKSIPFALTDRFIKFGPTDRIKDAAQTTVPFIDAQIVEGHNPTPLSGVGIYYKSTPGYGGFIAPKVQNYNFAAHIFEPQTTGQRKWRANETNKTSNSKPIEQVAFMTWILIDLYIEKKNTIL